MNILVITLKIGERPVCPRCDWSQPLSSQCLEAFYCSSAMSDWWSIATWTNRRHSKNCHFFM